SVLVSWSTEQEVNSSYFSVERSSNASDFTDIGTVAAKGNSATVSNYSYTDNGAQNGVNYYRLKMVDLDGSFVYSQVSVVNSELVQNVKVFPNPASNYIYITLGGSVPTTNVRLIDLTGKLLQEQRLNATSLNSTISMPVSNYAQGIYILQIIKADGTKWSTKVTIGIKQ
ncbi:MAG TPA: T9SS type A sorting domain-containing protein, partial [Puia sp.]|nr:T9SS type A sorting domain-containing protein [Puia sp.]